MALDQNKTELSIGLSVNQRLIELGVETPMTSEPTEDTKGIEEHFRQIMILLGMDLSDDSLQETPRRVAKMFLREVFWGLSYRNFPKVTSIDNKMQYSAMLMERHIKVNSYCEHHFVPIMGQAFVAYIPDKKVIGLSKINRVVEFFCRRPQVQERLTEQIHAALCLILETENVAVLIKAQHLCVQLRGVEDTQSDTITSRLGGVFFDTEQRNEFLQQIKL